VTARAEVDVIAATGTGTLSDKEGEMTEALALDLQAVRAQLPVTQRIAYLNTGTAGPLPASTAAAMEKSAASELADGRIGMDGFLTFFEQLSALRGAMAHLVGAEPGEIGLTHNTTEGMNIGLWGIDWKPGDEIVTTTLEHGGGLLPLYQLHRRRGIKVTFTASGHGEMDVVMEGMRRAIHPGVKMVVLSHVTYQTGAVLPLREIVDLAHAAGALVLVDGAQSVGAIPLDLHQLGADFYAFPGQKWLCGPEGTGGIFVRRDRLSDLEQTSVGGFGVDHHSFKPDEVGFTPAEGAQRYEVGSLYRPGMVGLAASLAWIQGVGPVFAAIRDLAGYCLQQVRELPGAEVLTPEQPHLSGLVAVRLPDVDVARGVEFLTSHGVAIRSIPENGAFRISCGFYNTRAEIDRTMALLREFQQM
jgi:L-cysteine/cystine lyase